ncbi:hypothetical protein LTSEUGA_2974, partial [Salmonella enterica subsp. enterica serovar Uganda str. R8-3404]
MYAGDAFVTQAVDQDVDLRVAFYGADAPGSAARSSY